MKTFCRISAIAFSILLSVCSLSAQQGVHGARTITAANTPVNEYTPLTANAAANATIITVTNSTLNGNGRFTANLAPGDLVMIIQIQGITLNGSLNGTIASPTDTSWGQVLNYNNCGRYEFAQVKSVPSATTIELDCGLQFSYSTGGTNRAQVVRVPRWTTLTVNAGGSIVADDWNGFVGGIVAIETQGNAVINGSIDASGRGFRGGALLENVTAFGVDNVGSTDPTYGAEKGEGIAGYQADYDPMGGRYGRGAAANGGGGGCGHNGGGGGGANGGTTANWRGMGIPDPNAAYTAAWNLDNQFGLNYLTTLTTANSAGGGRGGYCFSDQNSNATTVGPGSYASAPAGWGGDGRRWQAAGLGGRPLDYSSGRLFLGGGGGAGDQNQAQGGAGGDGGGLIYIMCYGNVSGTGTIVSNGNNGLNAAGTAPSTSYAGRDAAGGGGAGGTIVINAVGTLTGISATANGGNGGNQVMTRGAFYFGAINEAEGPGGGGGGGHIAISTGAITRTANGGLNGTTNSDALTEFPPNGAMRGGNGTTNATITNFTIAANGATICSGQTATLTASVSGTPPTPQSVLWYAAATGGNPIATGNSFTTPALTTTTTYYVGTCPGTYRVPVTVTVNPLPLADAGANTSICIGNTTTLTATGGGTYIWNGGTLVNAAGASQTVSPATTTTYTVSVTLNGCTATDQVTVSINNSPVAVAGIDQTICSGSTATLTGSGGGTYTWNGGALVNAAGASQTVTPTTTTDYVLTVSLGNGCEANDTVRVLVNPNPIANAGSDLAVCIGDTVSITATGGNGYSWNGGALVNASGATQSVSPATTTNYVVQVTDANNCIDTDTVQVQVNPLPLVTTNNNSSICANSSIQLIATGAQSYVWSPASGLSSTTVANPTASPAATTTYVVSGTDSNGCVATDSVTVTVTNVLSVSAGNDVTICSGDSTQLSTSGGVTYNWTPASDLSNSAIANPFASPLTTTTYAVLVTDANGCQGSDSVTVFVNSPLSLSVTGAQTICIGQTASITASPSGGTAPYTYVWSNSLPGNPSHTVSPAITTTYTVSVTDSLGCSAGQQTVTVTVNPPLNLSVTGTTTICSGATAQVTATGLGGDGNYTYVWQPGNISGAVISVTPATTTVYTVTVTDGCGTPSQTSSVTVTVAASPNVTISPSSATGCAPLCVNFTGQSSANCASSAWDFGDGNTSTQSAATNCYTQSGSYTVIYTCTDVNGCVGSDTAINMVNVSSEPTASFTVNPATSVIVMGAGGSQQICFDDNTAGATTWTWNFNSNVSNLETPCFTVNDTGTYCAELVVANAAGCDDTANYCLRVVNEAVFFFPNVFTPNGDGTNDIFTISGTGIKTVHCYVFDRWGIKVGEWNSPNGSWDGRTTSGQAAVDGVYYFTAEVTDFNNKVVETTGYFQLIR